MPARKENAVTIHMTALEAPARDVSYMEKPPVAMVVKLWLMAENQLSPAIRRAAISQAVRTT